MAFETRRGIGTETVVKDDPATGETLHAHSTAGASAAAVGPEPAAEGEPVRRDVIGRFLLLGVLGAGGMGLVFSAYDPHLDRKVALKLLLAGGEGGEEAARLRLLREAQAMARINHPNVVKVHEVGTHDEQVYVAMELIDGGTLREWLAGAHTPREILDVLVQAGRGLAAAHAAGLVHRDFKPENVLLTKDGGVRVTDFGIVGLAAPLPAAPTEPDAPPTEPGAARPPLAPPSGAPGVAGSASTPLHQGLTRTGSLMGTPIYMAPEQFRGGITTARVDQFAFCVVLYEALYGERPFAATTYEELSSNVQLGRVSPTPRGARVPAWLRRVLLRGLSVDPAARYPSMDALLSELVRERVLRRRRRLAWAAGVVVPAAAVAAIALGGRDGAVCEAGGDRVAAVWSPGQRDRIQAAFLASGRPHAAASFDRLSHLLDAWGRSWALGYRDACQDTRVRGVQSERLLDLRMQCLTRRLDDAGATIALLSAGGGDAVDHALEAAMTLPAIAPCADAAALAAPVAPPETAVARARVEAVRGRLDEARGLERLGRYAAALDVARAALAAARTAGYRPAIAEALLVVGRTQVELAAPGAPDALRESMQTAAAAGDGAGMIEAAAWLVFALTEQGNRHELAHEIGALADAAATHARPPAEIAVRLQLSIGALEEARGRPAEARARYGKALAIAEQELGPGHLAALNSLSRLGSLAKVEGRFADARQRLERVLAAREELSGKDHPDVANALNNLGLVYKAEGKLDDAQRLAERALAIRLAALGPDHPEVGTSYNNLGTIHAERADHAAAATQYAKALALWEKAYGPDNVQIASAVMNLGTALDAQGQLDPAAMLYERTIAIFEAAHGPEHPGLIYPLTNLGVTRHKQHRLDEAVAALERATRLVERTHGPDHPDIADTVGNLAVVRKDQRRLDEARALTDRSQRIVERAYGADHPRFAAGLINVGELQAAQGDHAGALATYQRSAAIFEAQLGKDHVYVSYGLFGLGSSLVELRRAPEAAAPLERALQLRAAASSPPAMLAEVRAALARALAPDPRTRTRAIAEARAAAAEYEQAGEPARAAEVRRWLAGHR